MNFTTPASRTSVRVDMQQARSTMFRNPFRLHILTARQYACRHHTGFVAEQQEANTQIGTVVAKMHVCVTCSRPCQFGATGETTPNNPKAVAASHRKRLTACSTLSCACLPGHDGRRSVAESSMHLGSVPGLGFTQLQTQTPGEKRTHVSTS